VERLELSVGTVDLVTGEVHREPPVTLSPMELQLLCYLAQRPGEVVKPDELLREVWGYAASVRSRTVRTTMGRLRAKVERDPRSPDHLLTEYGAGYRFAQLPTDEPAGGAAAPSASSPAASGGNQVPAPLMALEPREEQAAVDAAVQRGARLVTLVGPAGMGKTSLLQLLGRQRDAPGGVVWADLSGLADGDQLVVRVAEALDLTPEPGADLAASVGAALESRGRCELFLDDVDGMVDAAAAQVTAWLQGAGQLRVFVACREPLRVGGEARIRLGPLPDAGAARVLRRRLQDRGAAPDRQADEEALGRLVTALDGVPLALELAAAAAAVDGLEAVASDIEARLLALRTDRRDAPRRHDSLDAALSTSVARCEPVERAALSQLALFRGPIRPDDAEQVVDLTRWQAGVRRTARRLGDVSLLQLTAGRWRLLGATRAYAWAHHPPPLAARARFVTWATTHAQRLRSHGDERALHPIRDHLTAAHALADDAAVRALLDGAIASVDRRSGLYQPADARLERALQQVPDDRRGLRAWLATRQVQLWLGTGRDGEPRTLALAEQAATDATAAGDDRAAVQALRQVARICRAVAPARAIEALDEAVACGRRLGPDHAAFQGLPQAELGKLRAWFGPLDAAREAFVAARERFVAAGNEGQVGTELWLSRIDRRRGDLASAEAWLTMAREHLDPANLQQRGSLATATGRLAYDAGRHADALVALDEALQLAEQVGHGALVAMVSTHRALVCCDLGRLDAARATLDRADPEVDPLVDAVSGLVAVLQGEQTRGLALARRARDHGWPGGNLADRSLAAELFALVATVAAPDEAAAAWEVAVAWAGPAGDRLAGARAGLGHAVVAGGEVPRVPPLPELRAMAALASGRAPVPADARRFVRVRILGGFASGQGARSTSRA